MARLGPFGPAPRLGLGVSGGADSMALAVLAQRWAAANGATVLALIVDHGLRAAAAAEAALTANRLDRLGIPSLVLTLSIGTGPAVQARARLSRHRALAEAARAAGCLHLLLGHHKADQAETVTMRAARGAGGSEGMAAWAARRDVVLLRPLLGTAPAELRRFLLASSIAWIEDPSNADPRFERSRLRAAGGATATANPARRQADDQASAAFLARHVTLHPEGFGVIAAAAAPAPALAALLRVIGGRDFAPNRSAVAALASALRPTTLGGVQIARRRGGWLLAREPADCAPPLPAQLGSIWDRRFRLAAAPPPGASFGALGADAAAFRKTADLPALVLRGLPCLRHPGGIVFPAPAAFLPPAPATSHPFLT